jgi:hypothetical protein
MGDSSEVRPGGRAKAHDGDVLAPRGETVQGTEAKLVSAPSRVIAQGEPGFIPPVSAIGPLFIYRLERIYRCRVEFQVDVNNRATTRVLGGYYKSRRLVRIYARDREQGQRQRPLEELFDTFLHEVAHHLEYTEPFSFSARACGRVPGRMHSRLFWRILGELKYRWARVQEQQRVGAQQAR